MIRSNLKHRKICVNILIEKRRKGRVIQKNNRTLKIEYREIYRKIRKRASQKRERCKEDDRRSTGNGWYDVIGRSAKLKQRSGLITGEGMNAPRHHQRSKKVTRLMYSDFRGWAFIEAKCWASTSWNLFLLHPLRLNQ